MSNDTIKELSSSSEDFQEVPEDVLEFLKEVGPDPIPTHLQSKHKQMPDKNRTATNFNKPVMAFNAWPSRTLLSFKTQGGQVQERSPQRNNFTRPGENTITDEQKEEIKDSNREAEKKWVLDDIDFDKIDKLLIPR